jgi:hypothetical protein
MCETLITCVSYCLHPSDATPCATGWYGYEGSCYLLSFSLPSLSAPDASKECAKHNAVLATVQSDDVHGLFTGLLSHMPYLSDTDRYFIGLLTPFHNEVYITADGSVNLVNIKK